MFEVLNALVFPRVILYILSHFCSFIVVWGSGFWGWGFQFMGFWSCGMRPSGVFMIGLSI